MQKFLNKHSVMLLCILSGLVCIALHANYILVHFYEHGAYFLDTGWFSDLFNEKNMGLRNPSVLNEESYYATHLSPLIAVWSYFSKLAPLSSIQWTSLTFAIMHFTLFLFVVLAVSYYLRAANTLVRAVVPFVLSLIYGFNHISISTAQYPHFEVVIPGLILLGLLLISLGRVVLGSLILVMALMSREDAAGHLFGLLFFVCLWFRFVQKKNWYDMRIYIAWLAVSGLYLVTAISVQKTFYPQDSAFVRIYSGDPPFDHVTFGFVRERLVRYISELPHLYLPVIACLFWACFKGRRAVVLGYLSNIPWLLLSFFAASDVAGEFRLYYAFPFILGLCWPLLYFAMFKVELGFKDLFFLFIVGCLAISPDRFYMGFFKQAVASHSSYDLELQEMRDVFSAMTPEVRAGVAIDGAIASFFPNTFNQENMISPVLKDIHTIVYHRNYPFEKEAISAISSRYGLIEAAEIKNSHVIIVSNKFDQYFSALKCRLVTYFPRYRFNHQNYLHGGEIEFSSDLPLGVVAYGPYISLRPGKYRLDVSLVVVVK